jgi:NAD(P) transhydrogenase subunit alpha
MVIGVPRETRPDERRVAATPETVHKLVGRGHTLVVEAGAGLSSSIGDDSYRTAGARLADADTVYAESELLLKVQRPRPLPDGRHEADQVRDGASVVCLFYGNEDPDAIARLRARNATVLAMEAVPRIARAQSMDALSSMANIAGYRAVLEAASHFPRFMPMLMTAAGTVPPAQVLVIGVGVAGLSAIATARRLGAQVKAFDVRAAVQDQIRSVGAEPIPFEMPADTEDKGGYAKAASDELLRREQALFESLAPSVDIVITTALIGGKIAPPLFTEAAVRAMRPGSVVVDLSAEQGGNCTLTRAGEVVTVNGVTILGHTNLSSRMPNDASRLYARNILNLLVHMHTKQGWAPDFNEEITKAVRVLYPGQEA